MKLAFLFVASLMVLFPSEVVNEKMQWDENRKLTWNDFKGTPNVGNGFVASTNSGISFSFSYSVRDNNLNLDYTIESNFYPELSWYIAEDVSPYILKHEQTHFDISELHARKLRKLIEESTFSLNPKEEINSLYNSIEEKRRAMQKKYDAESDHSKIPEEELKWRAFIADQLQAYEPWK